MPAIRVSAAVPAALDVESVVLLVRPGEAGPVWRRGARRPLLAAGLTPGDLDALDVHLERAASDGSAGGLLDIPFVVAGRVLERVILLGGGDRSPGALRRAGAALARATREGDVWVVGLPSAERPVRAFVEGLELGGYAFRRSRRPVRRTVTLLVPERATGSVERARTTAAAVRLARDLTNTPSSTKSPQWMVEQARRVAREAGLEMRTRDHRALAREGFGGLVGVGQGSSRPPRLVELTYRPDQGRPSSMPHVVLVGKGITFDTGGISIKPTVAMTAMKTDMAGAGAVLAVLGALRALDVQVRVTGLLALAENMPSGSAQRPGDVLTQYGGTTVEVLNTDAEGRLVLADALAYAVNRLRPDVVVDLATLTGAVGIALGRRDAALFATDERLAARLHAASAASGERVWRLPLVEDYRPALNSSVADLANIAVRPAPGAGAVLAGLFLREFVGQVPWAHLDIAGTGRSEVDDHEISRGGTGFGVRLLLSWLESGRLR